MFTRRGEDNINITAVAISSGFNKSGKFGRLFKCFGLTEFEPNLVSVMPGLMDCNKGI